MDPYWISAIGWTLAPLRAPTFSPRVPMSFLMFVSLRLLLLFSIAVVTALGPFSSLLEHASFPGSIGI
jgi:hypothetical protein